MKNKALQSIIEDSLTRMFVYDKRGKLLFFPGGNKKPGYFINSKSLETKIRKFYATSFFIGVVIFLIGIAIFHDFWGFFACLIVCFGGLHFIQQSYFSRIVKSLPMTKVRYKDVLLEQYEPDDAEESSESDFQVP